MVDQNLPRRAHVALAVGAILGGSLTASMFTVVALAGDGIKYFFVRDIFWILISFVLASILWAAGLAVFALAPWRWVHKRGHRRWYIAAALGFLLTFAVDLALNSHLFGLIPPDKLTPHEWLLSAGVSSMYGLIGGIVGFVIWSVAYLPKSE